MLPCLTNSVTMQRFGLFTHAPFVFVFVLFVERREEKPEEREDSEIDATPFFKNSLIPSFKKRARG